MDFETFHKALTSDELWMEAMRNPSRGKDLKAAIEKVYGQVVSDGTLKIVSIGEHRKHVFNTLGKMPFSKVNTVQLQQEEKKQEPVPYKAFATDAQREWHLKTWLDQIANTVKTVTMPRMSHKEIAEEGDWLPPKRKVPTDPLYIHEHQRKLHQCRIKIVRERHPNMSDEEIEKYIQENF